MHILLIIAVHGFLNNLMLDYGPSSLLINITSKQQCVESLMTLNKNHSYTQKLYDNLKLNWTAFWIMWFLSQGKSLILRMVWVVVLWLNGGLWSLILTDQPYIQISMFGNPYGLQQKSSLLFILSHMIVCLWTDI